VASLSLIAACTGVFNQEIYSKVVSRDLLPGTVAQDAISIIVGFVLLFLSLTSTDADIKKQIVITSLLAYLFYGYGIYVFERVYNLLYLVYMAIVALSFWSIVYGLVHIKPDVSQHVKASKWVRYLSAGCLLFTALLFYVLWSSQLLPLMRAGEKIESSYSIFILDMVFVLPALIISGVLLIMKNALGAIFAPILFFKAFTLLFSVGLGGLMASLFGQTIDPGQTAFYLVLSIIYLAFAILDFWKISFQEQDKQ
jgi:hypothetical protein